MMRKNIVVLMLTLTAAVFSSGTAQQIANAQQTAIRGGITLSMANVAAEEALAEVARQAGLRLVVRENFAPLAKRITVNGENLAVGAALQLVMRGTGAMARVASDGETIVVEPVVTQIKRGSGVIAGKVTDAKTGKSLQSVRVAVDNESNGVVTGEDGTYRLPGIAAGSHTVTARLVGYTKQVRSLSVGDGATVTADFKMEPNASVLDQVIVTGTVVATELKAVPNAITVVTAKQLEDRGITKIDQLFRGDIPGLFVQNRGGDNMMDSVIMFSRGATKLQPSDGSIASNTIKVYVDGIEMMSPGLMSQIDPRSIERIEILTGPQASTIYGSNAINGVMQIFTKRGATARPQLVFNLSSGVIQNSVSTALSPIHTYDGRMSGMEGKLSYQAGGAWDYTGRWTPAKQTARVTSYGGGRVQLAKFTVDGTARRSTTVNRQNGFSSEIINNRRETGLYSASAATALSGVPIPANGTREGTTLGFTIGVTPLQWWSHEVTVGSDASNAGSLTYGLRAQNPGDSLLGMAQAFSKRASQRYATTAQLPLASRASATLTFGVDHWRTTASSFSARPTSLTGSLASPAVTRTKPDKNTGGFFQGQLGFLDALFITYGLRAEWNPNYGDEAQPNLAPRYGIAYTRGISVVTAKLRASYGRSTRPPTENQKSEAAATNSQQLQLYGPFIKTFASPDLEPEVQQGGEGGIELYFGNRGSLVVTRYNQTVDKLIKDVPVDSVRSLLPENPLARDVLQSDGYGYLYQRQYLNVGSIRNQGWELQGSINTGPFTTRGTYSWTKSRVIGITQKYRSYYITGSVITTDPSFLPGAPFRLLPEHTWALNIAYARSATNISLNINGTGDLYVSRSPLEMDINGLRLLVNKPRTAIPISQPIGQGYSMADLNASQRLSSQVEGILQVQNLTNFYQNDYIADYATIGRQTKVGLRIKL